MIIHPALSILCAADERNESLMPFISYLQSIKHIQLTISPQIPADLSSYDVIITPHMADHCVDVDTLRDFVNAGGGLLGLVNASDSTLPQIFGAQPNAAAVHAEVRVLIQNKNHAIAMRLEDSFYARGVYRSLTPNADDAEIILYADWHHQRQPMLIKRQVGRGCAACTTLQSYNHPAVQQILYRLLRFLAGQAAEEPSLGIGILGYAPSVGQLHGNGINHTAGLSLRAICDVNPLRLKQAQKDFSEVLLYTSADELAADHAIDLVIVATPPNSHAKLCLQMMAAGKHVVCEKPLAMNRKETGEMIEMAERQKVHLSCHQNRRFDVDYLAIKQAVDEGMIGDLFYMETFVGGFTHPCGYWHSHADISGGTCYDWGGHYLDWIVSLMPGRVMSVISTCHKRVWHDITNSDQERIQVRFDKGGEAEFIHSDIAAIRKPKWYLLGTEGAIIGHWQDLSCYEIDPVVYFYRRDIPPTEMPPDLHLHRVHHSGQIVTQTLPVPKRIDYFFHRNLADHLLTGEPIATPLADSVMVVAILEAAARSAAQGGTVEVPGE